MKRTLLLVIGGFALVLSIFALTTGYYTRKLHAGHTFLVQLDAIVATIQDHKENLQRIEVLGSYYDTLALNKQVEKEQIEAFYKSLRQQIDQNDYLGKTDKTRMVNFSFIQMKQELDLLNHASKIGFKEFGFIGEMRKVIHALENDYPKEMNRILTLRRHEKDFIMRLDNHYAMLFRAEIDHWEQQVNCPDAVIEYANQFDSLYANLMEMQKIKSGILAVPDSEYGHLLGIVRLKHKQTIQSVYEISAQAEKIQYLISISCLLILIIGSSIIIRKITNQVSSLLKNMSEFVLSNFQSNESIVKQLPKNEIGQIAVHFLKMARKIRSEVNLLEDRVKRRTLSLEQKNGLLEKQHENLMESLRYAQNLQQSMLVSRQQILTQFEDARIHYSPKNHVGGDFFWMKEQKSKTENKVLFALADCTGHGVPGALLSVLGMNTLDELVRSGHTEPYLLLTQLRETIIRRLNMQQDQRLDGMDMAIFQWDKITNEVQFAGAQLPLWILKRNELIELKPDRIPIGYTYHENTHYTKQCFQLEQGDRLLLFTDGLVDQFGMVTQKKLGKKHLRFLLNKHLSDSSAVIYSKLLNQFEFWKGSSEQTDDCTFILLEPSVQSPIKIKPKRAVKQPELSA